MDGGSTTFSLALLLSSSYPNNFQRTCFDVFLKTFSKALLLFQRDVALFGPGRPYMHPAGSRPSMRTMRHSTKKRGVRVDERFHSGLRELTNAHRRLLSSPYLLFWLVRSKEIPIREPCHCRRIHIRIRNGIVYILLIFVPVRCVQGRSHDLNIGGAVQTKNNHVCQNIISQRCT